MKIHRFLSGTTQLVASISCVWLVWLAPLIANAEEVGSSGCGHGFAIRGEVTHSDMEADRVVGATDREMYVEEVYGREFKAVVENLPEGAYTIEVYVAEKWATEPGKRVMDIYYGSDPIVQDLDIFARVGLYKELVLTRDVVHQGDSVSGPLTLTFKARVNNAKFNAITIKDSDGGVVSCVKAKDLINEDDLRASPVPIVDAPVIYTNVSAPFDVRADDLIRRMSLKEKVGQLMNSAPAIERLGVPAYDYWNECLHGVARAGHATVFPQAIGLAAMWDVEMMHRVADTIATEARAKNNAARARDPNTSRYYGLTFWTPNINIFRDPRWGRGHETYGEDPCLTGRLAVSFIRGLQGEDPKYFKAMACAKHFAVHSGPEKLRHSFNAVVSERDLYETYLPQFEAAVTEGHVGIVMSAYNAWDGIPCPANAFLLTELLRDRWGFSGHVVSDCGAVRDIWNGHEFVKTPEEASSLAIRAGNDLNCGGTFKALTTAVNKGLLTGADVNIALKHVLLARFKLGLFDTPEQCGYLSIPASSNDTPEHSRLALKAARESLVLLKNDGVLPLNPSSIKTIAVIGPNADSTAALVGNYNGDPSNPITILEGIRDLAGSRFEVRYAEGCPPALMPGESYSVEGAEGQRAVEVARQAGVVVFVGGLNAQLEGEEMRTSYEGFDRGDRITIELPRPQRDLLKALSETGRPVVYVNLSGSSIAMPWVAENLPAILQAWYPGQNGGTAVADVIFGRINPAGRLPITFYRSTGDLPDFLDYSMENRTYRYFKGEPLYPFGHGLSYTSFEYGRIEAASNELKKEGHVKVTVPITNSGKLDGEEVVQLYVRHLESELPQPIHSLAGFKRVSISKGATVRVEFDLPASALRYWDAGKQSYVVAAGGFEIQIGGSSTDIRATHQMKVR